MIREDRIAVSGLKQRVWVTALLLFALAAGLSLGGYLLAARWTLRNGFPLDDAWIHQTYARSLALRGEWAYLPGQPSAGSTAPLWSLLLAAGHALRLGPFIWTFVVGWVCLAAISWVGSATCKTLLRQTSNALSTRMVPVWGIAAGLLLAFEWHLAWAAGSGMETLLFALIVLLVLGQVAGGSRRWLALGLLAGLCAWVRPDGVTLLGPLGLSLLWAESKWRDRLLGGGKLALGAAVLVIPYLLFNRLLAGAWWPNTFFAKQAEYAVMQQAPLWQRFLQEAGLPLVGAGALLLPGFFLLVWQAARRRQWGVLAGAAWVAGYLLLYAWRLPVTYQHGRYVIPAMPVFFVWGLAGLALWLRVSGGVLRRATGKAWALSLALVLAGFWLLGARSYGRDVAVIETEMVDTAGWVNANTEPESVVAAHDIGALGYFGERNLLDLAGLVSPEVIPFIRDERRLAEYLDERGAAVLVSFPGWYPDLVKGRRALYCSAGQFSPELGGENMCVYVWGVR